MFRVTPLLGVLVIFFCSCQKEIPVQFPVRGTSAPLAALGKEAAAGFLDFSGSKKITYRFSSSSVFPPFLSMEIEYDFSPPLSAEIKSRFQLVLETGGASWELPLDFLFLGRGGDEVPVFHYAVPLEDAFSGLFSIALVRTENGTKTKFPRNTPVPGLRIRSLELKKRWFGFYPGENENHIHASPFVFFRTEDGSWVIDPPAVFGGGKNLFPEISADFAGGKRAVLEAGGMRVEISPFAHNVSVPPPFFGSGPFILSGDTPEALRLSWAAPPPFPDPIESDPGLVLERPQKEWRGDSYEIFRWRNFPSLLIFDTVSYAVQDRLFKRLAFFTEKAGFRGRLAPDAEIAELHGWNAHDYRAEDLARFFDLARRTNFPLLAEERELETILLNEGIIRAGSGGISAGEGGVISISRESPSYLRSLFMAHEGFHGIFFIDEDFRAFSRRRFEGLDPGAKRFILSYFDYQHYDIKDDYLVVNEFMAHLLQQPPSQAGRYFGQTLPSRLESSWRRSVLGEKDEASSSWPALAAVFSAEAEAFSAYVNRRWGLAAGRVYLLRLP